MLSKTSRFSEDARFCCLLKSLTYWDKPVLCWHKLLIKAPILNCTFKGFLFSFLFCGLAICNPYRSIWKHFLKTVWTEEEEVRLLGETRHLLEVHFLNNTNNVSHKVWQCFSIFTSQDQHYKWTTSMAHLNRHHHLWGGLIKTFKQSFKWRLSFCWVHLYCNYTF